MLELTLELTLEMKQVEQPGSNGERPCNWCRQHHMYCLWPLEGIQQKSCDHCAAQKIPCAVNGIWVSNQKQQDRSRAEGSQPQKRSRVEVEELDVESEWSRLGGWKARGMQDIAFGLLGIKDILREQNGLLRRKAQGLDGLRSQ